MKLKVGDIVWSYEETCFVESYEISYIDKDGYYDAGLANPDNDEGDEGILFNDDDIGELVFLTKEECEEHRKNNFHIGY